MGFTRRKTGLDDPIGPLPIVLERQRGQLLAAHPLGVLVKGPEGLGGVFRKVEHRIAMLLQIFDPGRDIDDPHEAAQDRFLGTPGHAHNRFGGGQRVGHRLRRQDHQGPVYAFILYDR